MCVGSDDNPGSMLLMAPCKANFLAEAKLVVSCLNTELQPGGRSEPNA